MSDDTTKKRSYGFYLLNKPWANCEAFTVKILCREPGESSPINCDSSYESEWRSGVPKKVQGLRLSDLAGRLYYNPDYGHVHAPVWGYEDVHTVGLREAGAMIKTLGLLDRAMTKAGSPTDIGDWVDVTAKALGLEWWVYTEAERGWSYSDSDWRWLSVSSFKATMRTHRLQFDLKAEEFRKAKEARNAA